MVEDATVVRRSLERGLDPSRRATSRHLAALVYKEAARIAYIYSGHSIRIPTDCVFVLRHAEVQCASVPLVPIRAGISNRQPIPGPALSVYCRVVFVENCHSLTNSFVYDFERFFFCLVKKF